VRSGDLDLNSLTKYAKLLHARNTLGKGAHKNGIDNNGSPHLFCKEREDLNEMLAPANKSTVKYLV